MTARVLIRLKPGILDVQGASVQRALGGLGFPEVRGDAPGSSGPPDGERWGGTRTGQPSSGGVPLPIPGDDGPTGGGGWRGDEAQERLVAGNAIREKHRREK